MAKGLIDTLLRFPHEVNSDGAIKKSFRTKLFEYLDDGISLVRLRATCRALRDIVGHLAIGRVFCQVYIRAPPPDLEDITLFERIARHCSNLKITIVDQDAARETRRTRSNRPSSQIARRSQEFVQNLFDRLDLMSLNDSTLRLDSRASTRDSTASFRQSLVSRFSGSSTPRSPISPARLSFDEQHLQDEAIEHWVDVLKPFKNLTSLTLRIHGDTNWPGRTEVENTIVHVRNAIEQANLPRLGTMSFMPVHAMGVIHLNWLGLNAFGASLAFSTTVWQRIQTLDLRIHYPATLSNGRQAMFLNSLYTYLSSFSRTLRCLRFVWLGTEGPSPLVLFQDPSLKNKRAPIYWLPLEELWLGNVTHPHQTIRMIPEFAPRVKVAKNLRSTRRDSLAVDANDESAWMEIMLAQTMFEQPFDDHASSVYSNQSARSSDAWEGGVSRSDVDVREVPFMLDMGR